MIRKIILVLAAAVASLAAAVPAVAATHPSGNTPSDDPTHVEIRGIDKHFLGDFSGDWTHCEYVTKAHYTQTAGCSQGKTVTESVSGNVGYSKAGISAAVGFNVAYSTTVTASNSVTIKPGGSGWFDVGFRYGKYTIKMENRLCFVHGGCDAWSKPDKVTVQKHLGNTFHYFGTGAE
jgi:hypothetical protein